MSLTYQHGAPSINILQEGKYTSNRIYKVEAAAATPVEPTYLDYIIGIDVDDGAPEEVELFHQGGGDERAICLRKWKWSGSITVHKGKLPYVLSQLLGITWDSTNAAIPFKIPYDFPHVHWEAVCRQKDNSTHLFTLVIQDMIIDRGSFSNPLESADGVIPFHTYYPPLYLAQNVELVYDVFTGDGSTTQFTASSTPVNLLSSVTGHDDFFLPQVISIKEKAPTALTGNRKKSGYSYSAGKFIAATAPADGTLVQILYAKLAA